MQNKGTLATNGRPGTSILHQVRPSIDIGIRPFGDSDLPAGIGEGRDAQPIGGAGTQGGRCGEFEVGGDGLQALMDLAERVPLIARAVATKQRRTCDVTKSSRDGVTRWLQTSSVNGVLNFSED